VSWCESYLRRVVELVNLREQAKAGWRS
jgi:hypothetical protein